ncbi:hypothetical protein ACFQO4_20715 [Saliphagus sp. GCM10025334]
MNSNEKRTMLYLGGVVAVLSISLPVFLARERGVSGADLAAAGSEAVMLWVTSPLTLAFVLVFAILYAAYHRLQQARLRRLILENDSE